jgi:hypothetical protein
MKELTNGNKNIATEPLEPRHWLLRQLESELRAKIKSMVQYGTTETRLRRFSFLSSLVLRDSDQFLKVVEYIQEEGVATAPLVQDATRVSQRSCILLLDLLVEAKICRVSRLSLLMSSPGLYGKTRVYWLKDKDHLIKSKIIPHYKELVSEKTGIIKYYLVCECGFDGYSNSNPDVLPVTQDCPECGSSLSIERRVVKG